MAPSRIQNRSQGRQPLEDSPEVEVEVPALANPAKTLQHLFLQALISRRTMSGVAAEALYAQCAKLCGVAQNANFWTWIGELEEPLHACGLAIKRAKYDDDMVIALVNTISDDEPSKLATEYKPEEIAFFRVVVEKIMTAPSMSYCVSVTDAVRCVSNAAIQPQITKNAAQGLLKSFIAKGWFKLHPSRNLSLSNRALLELETYLRETFEEQDDDRDPRDRPYMECRQCSGIVTSGWACPNADCTVRLHKNCQTVLNRGGKCPGEAEGCTEIWSRLAGKPYTGFPVGLEASNDDAAFVDDEDELATQAKKGGRKSAASGKAKPKPKPKPKKGCDEEVDELDNEDEDEPPATPVRQRSSRGAAAAKYVDAEADGEDEDMYDM